MLRLYRHRMWQMAGETAELQAEEDREREEWLRCRGLHIVRLDNDEVLRDLEPVLEGLAVLLESLPISGTGRPPR